MADPQDADRPPSGETDLLAEIEQQKILTEKQPLAGSTVLTTVFCPAWQEWLARFSEHSGRPMDALLAEALAQHARRLGFPEPAPENG